MKENLFNLLRRPGLPTAIVTTLCLLYVSFSLARVNGDPLKFVRYDGHYAYQIVFRSFPTREAVPEAYRARDEIPSAYRYQRILYPALARLATLGRDDWVLWALIVVNIVTIGAGTWATEGILSHLNQSRWYALAYGLYGGQLVALRADMNEPVAQMCVQFAIWAWLKKRPLWTVVAFALATLAKETAILFLVPFFLYHVGQRQWRWSVLLAMASLPYLLFNGLLWALLGETGIGGTQPFIWVPFGGWLMVAQMHWPTFLAISLLIVPLGVLPCVAGLLISLHYLRQRLWHPFVLSLLFNSLFILFLPHLTFRESSAVIRVVQGLAVSLLLLGALVRSPRLLNYSLFWIFSNVLLIE